MSLYFSQRLNTTCSFNLVKGLQDISVGLIVLLSQNVSDRPLEVTVNGSDIVIKKIINKGKNIATQGSQM